MEIENEVVDVLVNFKIFQEYRMGKDNVPHIVLNDQDELYFTMTASLHRPRIF